VKLQQIVAIGLLLSLMFGAGLQLDRAALATELKNTGLIARAIVASVIVVPLAGFFFAWAFHLPPPIAAGLLLMAMASGVPFVVLSGGRQKGGSHELAVTLALVLPVISAVTIPFTADLLLPNDIPTKIPVSQLVGLVAFQLMPLVVGALVAAFFPAIARKIARPVAIVTIVTLLGLLAILSPAIFQSVVAVFGKFGIIAMLGTTLASLMAGWFLSDAPVEHRRTLAMATLLRNPATAGFIATTEFKDPLVSATVFTYFVVQFIVATVAGKLFTRSSAS